jgi:hypothetical protein
MLENALEYKQKWTAELERRSRAELDLPDLVPHPDDIVLDMRNGTVRIEGPLDEREKAEWDQFLVRRAEAQDEVSYLADRYRRARSDQYKARWLEDWHWEQRMFDIINDRMPPRYKSKLENRSGAPGVLREDQAPKELIGNKKVREEHVG